MDVKAYIYFSVSVATKEFSIFIEISTKLLERDLSKCLIQVQQNQHLVHDNVFTIDNTSWSVHCMCAYFNITYAHFSTYSSIYI